MMIGRIIGLLLVRFHRKSLRESFTTVLILPQSLTCRSIQSCRASSTTFLACPIRSSDPRTYTNPLDTISGPDRTMFDRRSRVMTTIMIPSSARCWRSRSTMFPTSPTPRPSTKIAPTGTLSVCSASSSSISSTFPERRMNTFSFGIPKLSARFA